ncbi:MAG: DUF3179 domain-containing protein [Pseudomonadota bacterium]
MRLAVFAAVFAAFATALSAQPAAWVAEFPNTDFSRTAVDFGEILDGGPPRDGIPALSDPSFIPVADELRIPGLEPVVAVEFPGAIARAYPLRYLTWHEIVNDDVAGIPIAVTFCPLCNSAITFDRRVGDAVLTFGVSGRLRHSDMVMYDRETESWWQQAVGRGIVGHYMDTELSEIATWVESLEIFRDRNPDGLVMDAPQYRRDYGRNPYNNYDSGGAFFLYSGELPPHDIEPLSRVVRVGDRAWPLARLAAAGEVVEAGVTITWTAGQASALDTARMSEGRDIGNIRVRDSQGADLSHDVMFAFAYHAFWPEGAWMLGP